LEFNQELEPGSIHHDADLPPVFVSLPEVDSQFPKWSFRGLLRKWIVAQRAVRPHSAICWAASEQGQGVKKLRKGMLS
jgi:hypothetical protein